MTFTSYAQNFEDVMLNRALKGVEKGCYIDVGANDPFFWSVTRAFYERGWRGVNIEPVLQHFNRLKEARSEDINIQAVAATYSDKVGFYEVIDTGLSTMDQQIAKSHAAQGYEVRYHQVPAIPVSSICDEHGIDEIHFMNIDVEGAEEAVLRGIDFKRHRPWIILVEAISPVAAEPNYQGWEPLLIEGGYRFVYFDGLNRFYVANERADLAKFFTVPPNVFDQFTLPEDPSVRKELERLHSQLHTMKVKQQATENQLQGLQRRLARLQKQVEQDEAERDAAVAARQDLLNRLHATEQLHQAAEAHILAQLHHIKTLEERLNKVYASTSWRMMGPVRGVGKLLKWPLSLAHRALTVPHIFYYMLGSLMRRAGHRRLQLRAAIRSLARRSLLLAVNFIQERPWLQSGLRKWIERFPGLRFRVRSAVLLSHCPDVMPPKQAIAAPAKFEAMPSPARTIYANLKHYMAARSHP